MQGIYKIQNGINGRYYVGSSNDIEKRWQEHKWALGKGRHSNDRLQKTWNKHGKEVFEFKFIEKVKNKEDLHLIEQRYLDEGFEKDTLYNIAREAAGGREPGWHHTEEAKAKMKKNRADQSGKNNPMYGRRHTEETKAKMSENMPDLSGKNHPMYGVTGKDSPRYGKHNTEEAKARAAKANARPYPAFYNVKTRQFLFAGKNLSKLCREQNLRYNIMLSLKKGDARESRSGWKLA